MYRLQHEYTLGQLRALDEALKEPEDGIDGKSKRICPLKGCDHAAVTALLAARLPWALEPSWRRSLCDLLYSSGSSVFLCTFFGSQLCMRACLGR